MGLKKIVAITGRPGLYKIISQTKGGLLVESLIDKKRIPINAIHTVSALNDIAMFTYGDEVSLRSILKTIADTYKNKKSISHKESKANLISFFRKILPDYDEDRVYPSNIKKLLQWYNILVSSKFDFSSIDENTNDEEE